MNCWCAGVCYLMSRSLDFDVKMCGFNFENDAFLTIGKVPDVMRWYLYTHTKQCCRWAIASVEAEDECVWVWLMLVQRSEFRKFLWKVWHHVPILPKHWFEPGQCLQSSLSNSFSPNFSILLMCCSPPLLLSPLLSSPPPSSCLQSAVPCPAVLPS